MTNDWTALGASWNSALAAVMRAERAALNMTMAQLAEKSHIPEPTLRNYIRGQRPIPVPALVMIANALEINIVQFWVRAEERLGDNTGPRTR